jgi:hypothetical protein
MKIWAILPTGNGLNRIEARVSDPPESDERIVGSEELDFTEHHYGEQLNGVLEAMRLLDLAADPGVSPLVIIERAFELGYHLGWEVSRHGMPPAEE